MTVFVDTSALLAVLDADDREHGVAARVWTRLVESDQPVWTTNYVLVETFALAQRRLGWEAARAVAEDVVPVLTVYWMTEEDHADAVAAFLTAARRQLSLVDCASFVVMRRLGLRRAFAFDRDFAAQGFALER